MTYDEVAEAYSAALDACNSRQRRFVEGLVQGRSQAESARLAGYARTSACHTSRMVKNGYVSRALELGRKMASMGASTKAEWVRSELRNIVETAEDNGSRISALRELAKIDGHYAPARREVSASGPCG